MKANKIVEVLMEENKVSKAQLGRSVGLEDKKASDLISKRLKQENISVNVLSEMLSAMGYTIVVAPKGQKLREGEYEVTINE